MTATRQHRLDCRAAIAVDAFRHHARVRLPALVISFALARSLGTVASLDRLEDGLKEAKRAATTHQLFVEASEVMHPLLELTACHVMVLDLNGLQRCRWLGLELYKGLLSKSFKQYLVQYVGRVRIADARVPSRSTVAHLDQPFFEGVKEKVVAFGIVPINGLGAELLEDLVSFDGAGGDISLACIELLRALFHNIIRGILWVEVGTGSLFDESLLRRLALRQGILQPLVLVVEVV
mmetsp:Transcript_61149/g.167609  ORF Transcript_61149/g.167609 Transcript_61149/m.167609 type:complete len:236 (-) Transcript_61149:1062-1769(-)